MVDNILQSFAKNGQVRDIGVPDDIEQAATVESLADKNHNKILRLLGNM